MRAFLASVLFAAAGCASTAPHAPAPMQLRRVILYQNGLGYLERTGHVTGESVMLRFARTELDDVLKTLTVIDRAGASVATVDVPTAAPDARTVDLGVRLAAGRVHDVAVSYAVPTPTWQAAYRVVLGEHALLQGWAMLHNASQEDWSGVSLTLATGAPMSFALDLHTPQYVGRPDATRKLAPANAIAPIDAEHATEVDRDGDGLPDAVDKCPDAPSHGDDDDGCPTAGHLVISDSQILVLEPTYFPKDGAALPAVASAILDADAQSLTAAPDLAKVEIAGHASADETDPWGLALRRAQAVRAALIARGVAAERLVAMPYGASQPRSEGAAGEQNRRVELVILKRTDEAHAAHGELTPAAVAASAHASAHPAQVAGAVRYALHDPISIRRGQSAMVSIVNQPITAEDAYLWRPDAGAPGSDTHPFRAVRLANTSGYTLEPGPLAVFARGSFVGDGLIGELPVGDTAWVPYALDGGATVTVATAQAERPLRVAAVRRGVLTVELAGVRTTTYTIAPGREPAGAIYLRHAKSTGYVAQNLPPGSLDEGDAYLVRVPLSAGRTSTLALEERLPRQKEITLLDAPAQELGAFADAGTLPPELAGRLHAAIELRAQLGAIDDELAALREQIADATARAEDLRASLRAIEHVVAADALRKKLVTSLAAANVETDQLARKLGERTDARAGARAALADAIRDLAGP